MAGSCTLLPDAFFVALIRSDRAEATSFTALINSTCRNKGRQMRSGEFSKNKKNWLEIKTMDCFVQLNTLWSLL